MPVKHSREADEQTAEQWAKKLAELQEQDVRFVLAAYTDVHGIPKAKAVPIEFFVNMMKGSELFTGAALEGLGQEPRDHELSLWPELDAVTVLPWDPAVAWAPGYLHLLGQPYSMCSRTVLQRQVQKAANLGLVMQLGWEAEFFLVHRRDDGSIQPANSNDTLSKAAYDVTALLENLPFMEELVGYMTILGWGVYSFDHEDANSQFECDFGYADAMTTADRFVLWRMMTKAVARKHGFEATFMPKPYADRTGNGAHFNVSFTEPGSSKNLFFDEDDPRGCGLSGPGYHFLGGVLRHARAISAVAAPTVNSYKRLVKQGSVTGYTWAPVTVSYGWNNRTHMLRIPSHGGRIESRVVDSSCNPYLTAAMYLAAGLEGIEQKLDPGEPLDDNMYELTSVDLKERGIGLLPRTLLEAVEALEADALGEAVLGADLRNAYVELKTKEWWAYHNVISQFELAHYLSFY